jgi:dipeptidyl-peptidase 4
MIGKREVSTRSTGVRILIIILLILPVSLKVFPQREELRWSEDGSSYYRIEHNQLVSYTLPDKRATIVISENNLVPEGATTPLKLVFYTLSANLEKALIFTNTKKVWRLNTRGDYWFLDLKTGMLKQLGKTFPPSSLMFAKFSPDGKYAAYVSGNNIYAEDLATAQITPLTRDGSVALINGTFDWAYEEEFFCRDGFRWSGDSKSVAYWQIDASKIKKFYMINNTDSIYPRIIPLEYPVAGEDPSSCRIGVVKISGGATTWMKIPGVKNQNYIVRMEFIPNSDNLLIQQLNRKQDTTKIYISDALTGNSKVILEETDAAWVDIYREGNPYSLDYTNNFLWMNGNRSILWTSEKDGWKHLYEVSLEGRPEKLITKGNFDVIELKMIDQKAGYVYFLASPDNATQQYLYRTSLSGTGKPALLSPASLKGTNNYSISPGGRYAYHTFSNYYTRPSGEFITLPDNKPLNEKDGIISKLDSLKVKTNTEFFRVTTVDNVEMDGWMSKPDNFDPSRKYPVVFLVYTEPWGATVKDVYGVADNGLYTGDMQADGYIYMSLDNRGTPAPKGRAWRKAIYRNIGWINIRDQAMGAKEILKWSFVDSSRIAVWGWSGGGSATLNLMLQHPGIYKTGIGIAAVTNLLTYDNIYEERYMGLPQENMEDYIKGSPVTYAANLTGNLLYIHGTGDDNVHYQNAEMLINQLVRYNRQFQFMAYPNRTHSISEGEGTSEHLSTLYTNYLRKYCPPGGR